MAVALIAVGKKERFVDHADLGFAPIEREVALNISGSRFKLSVRHSVLERGPILPTLSREGQPEASVSMGRVKMGRAVRLVWGDQSVVEINHCSTRGPDTVDLKKYLEEDRSQGPSDLW